VGRSQSVFMDTTGYKARSRKVSQELLELFDQDFCTLEFSMVFLTLFQQCVNTDVDVDRVYERRLKASMPAS